MHNVDACEEDWSHSAKRHTPDEISSNESAKKSSESTARKKREQIKLRKEAFVCGEEPRAAGGFNEFNQSREIGF